MGVRGRAYDGVLLSNKKEQAIDTDHSVHLKIIMLSEQSQAKKKNRTKTVHGHMSPFL